MIAEGALPTPVAHQNTTQVRGTQSFAYIMAQVWGRPSLMFLEILWRWLPAAVILGIGFSIVTGGLGMDVHLSTPATTDIQAQTQSISVFQPVAAVNSIHAMLSETVVASWPWLRWTLLTIFILWNIVAALGRTAVLRRLAPTLRARLITIFLLGTLRSALLFGAWFLWSRLVDFAAHTAILNPAAHNQEPSVVLLAAILIVGTLLLYVLWAIFSWFLQLAPLLAMLHNRPAPSALFKALGSTRVAGKLIEINLVMNIVRIALIVLAMVFSATPLPFSTVTTPTFLHWWWFSVILLWLAMSDYFHVVRAASYLSLYRTLEIPA